MENTLSSTLKHREHREWLSTLNFYQDEIQIFQNEMVVVAATHPDLPSIIEHVDEYRALFMRKLNKIADLRHRIALHEAELAKSHETNLEEVHDHTEVRGEMETLQTNFETLKKNFRMFASHND